MKIKSIFRINLVMDYVLAAVGIVSKAVLTAVLGVAIAILMLPTTSVAQDVQIANDEDQSVEEIIVTGSHIRRDTFTSASPITVLDGATLSNIGEAHVGDFLAGVPSITASIDATSGSGNDPQTVGISTSALRNMGTSRTLVLVNGRRFVSGMSAGAGYGVDMNAIPASIIERIEVLTGNQSAVYGSDSIAGVINIITKTNFDGVDLNMQFGEASRGDRERQNIELTMGKNFGDRNNAWASFSYAKDEGIMSRDRPWSEYTKFGSDTDGDGLHDILLFEGSSYIPESRLIGGGLSIKGDGSLFRGESDLATTDRYNFFELSVARLPSERKFASAGLTLNLSEKATATAEINYARVGTSTKIEPAPFDATGLFGVDLGGTTGIDLATHPIWAGSSAGNQFLAAGLTSMDQISTFRRAVEIGSIGTSNTRTTLRAAGAIEFEFDNGLQLDVSGVYGVTDQIQANAGDYNTERARAALNMEPDGSGGFQCVDPSARLLGCVPYNPINTVDSVAGMAGITGFSPAAIEYISVNVGLVGQVEQSVVSAVLSGELPFSVGNQDNLAFATGVEYREESGSETPDSLRQSGQSRLQRIAPTKGSFNVTEMFGELDIPLLDQLDLNLAVRVGDYSTVGNIASWKVGLDAPINDSFRLRSTVSSAIRAPNVSDLFAGRFRSGSLQFDPCNGVDAATTGDIADNCRTVDAIQNRITSEGSFTLTQIEAQSTNAFKAGSLTVQEEEATSFTFGIVFTPQALKNFSFAADFYRIEIENAIAALSGQTILGRCHDTAPSSFDPTCGGLLVRAVGSGQMLTINTVKSNETKLEASGIDVEARYLFENLGPGDLDISLNGSFITKFQTSTRDGGFSDLKGEILFPDFRLSLNFDYNVNDFNVFARMRYRDTTVDRNDNTFHSPNLNTMNSAAYVDMQASYRISESTKVFVGANNLFDKTPPVMGFGHKYFEEGGSGTNGTAFDIVGRQWYAGLNVSFF